MTLRFLKLFHSLLEIGLSYFLPLTASWESVRQIRFGELAFLVSFGDRLRLDFIAKLYTFGHRMRFRITSHYCSELHANETIQAHILCCAQGDPAVHRLYTGTGSRANRKLLPFFGMILDHAVPARNSTVTG